ncbi:uncharacterized protein [Chelonus insularis]|nr:uncharacterized protein LOC118069057 isoform X2 [Chelonus insularis]
MEGQSGVNHFPILPHDKSKRSIPKAHRGQSNHVNTVALDLPLSSRRALMKRRAHGALRLPKIQKKNKKRLSKIRSVHQSHLVSSRGIKSGKKTHKTKSKHNIRYEKTHQLEKRSRIKYVERKSEKNRKKLDLKVDKCSNKKLSIEEKEKCKAKRHGLHHR